MVDKFTGDGIMVIFGAPVEDLKHGYHPVITAIEMQDALQELRKNWRDTKTFSTRRGIWSYKRAGLGISGKIDAIRSAGEHDRIILPMT
jgi:class 3 adenylate cyclase